ncbi:hypothetical protein MCAP1_003390 [Malassezia caprae]|nr:hypothetical protein MCAP1_003390 [Malassezia caprae]
MTSPSAVEFGILHTLGNFGLVIMDSSYWQKAYSANVAAAVPGYLVGGIIYFGLPWCLGSVMGIGSLALQNFPSWPAYGRELSTAELNAGLILPYAGMAVAGKAGAVAVVIVVFMAVTSTMSAELIAVSSIISSDVYHTYLKRDASGKQIMFVSHLACIELIDDSSSDSVDFKEKAEAESPVNFEFSEDPLSPRIHTDQEEQYMRKMSLISGIAGAVSFVVVWIIWPFSMYGSRFIFQPMFFSGWLVVSVIWVFVGLLTIAQVNNT